MTIEIMNLRTDQPTEEYDVKIDRTSVLGNPYHMLNEKQRDLVCAQYEDYLKIRAAAGHLMENRSFIKELERLVELYKEHKQLRLFCWCAPKRCHGASIKRWVLNECHSTS